VVIGDNIRCATALGKSQSGPVEQFIVYVKPTRPDLSTTMTINTDRRSYCLDLTSWPNDFMVAVAWRYPQDEVAQLEAAAAQQEATDKAAGERGCGGAGTISGTRSARRRRWRASRSSRCSSGWDTRRSR
jgi:type IV secretory pathway VirB9-like protein